MTGINSTDAPAPGSTSDQQRKPWTVPQLVDLDDAVSEIEANFTGPMSDGIEGFDS